MLNRKHSVSLLVIIGVCKVKILYLIILPSKSFYKLLRFPIFGLVLHRHTSKIGFAVTK